MLNHLQKLATGFGNNVHIYRTHRIYIPGVKVINVDKVKFMICNPLLYALANDIYIP